MRIVLGMRCESYSECEPRSDGRGVELLALLRRLRPRHPRLLARLQGPVCRPLRARRPVRLRLEAHERVLVRGHQLLQRRKLRLQRYTPGYASGYTPGYTSEYTSGYTSGYTPGYTSGYTPGIHSGVSSAPLPLLAQEDP
eukprot:8977132-Pyramimonas_sp.AAC.2